MRNLLRDEIASFVKLQMQQEEQLLRHCDLLMYVACIDTTRHFCGRDVSMHLSHLILDHLPRDRVPLVVREAHAHFRNDLLPALESNDLPLFYWQLDLAAVGQEDATGLAEAWCDLAPDVRVLIWVLTMNAHVGDDMAPEDLQESFATALRHCYLLGVEFPPEAEELRAVVLDTFGAFGEVLGVRWITLLDRLLQSDDLKAVCLKTNEHVFCKVDFCVAYHAIRHFNEFYLDAEAFAKVDNDIKSRLIALYYHVFGLEVNDAGKARFRVLPTCDDLIGIPLLLDIQNRLELSSLNAPLTVHLIQACVHGLQQKLQNGPKCALRCILLYVLQATMRDPDLFFISKNTESSSPCELVEGATLVLLNHAALQPIADVAAREHEVPALKKLLQDAISTSVVQYFQSRSSRVLRFPFNPVFCSLSPNAAKLYYKFLRMA
ncbi:MAG: hypothetical protein MHM6MM_003080 [Cercozoa sp. M6MM]